MRFILFFFSAFALLSCDSNKNYYYREGSKEEVIQAKSDSDAYLKAYQRFQISVKVYENMEKSLGNTYLAKPISFELLNEEKEDITYQVFFDKKDSLENDIAKRIRDLPNNIEKAVENSSPIKTVSNINADAIKSVTESKTASYEGIKVNVKSVSTSTDWTFDSYDDEWHYRSAERGSKYIVAKISISSKINDPDLPPLSVYKINNGNISFIGNMRYEFARWKSYGHYLGNYADYGNDFAHSETIPFSCGLSVSSDDLANAAIIVVVHHKGCFYRNESRIGSPEVAYVELSCNVESLDPAGAGKSYTIIKMFNKSKL